MTTTKTVHAVVAATNPAEAALWAHALRGQGPLSTRVPGGLGRESLAWRVATMADPFEGVDAVIFITAARAEPEADAPGLGSLAAFLQAHRVPRSVPSAVIALGRERPGDPSADEIRARTGALGEPIVFRARGLASWNLGAHELVVTDPGAFETFPGGLSVGAGFVFDRSEGVARVRALTPEGFAVAGGRLHGATLPRLQLSSLTSDKAVYQEGRDAVHLLMVEPLRPGQSRTLVIERNAVGFDARPFSLDARGVHAATLRDLPGGSYRARIAGEKRAHEFLVARYALAPLFVELVESALEGETLRLRAALDTFGAPVSGSVSVALREAGREVSRVAFGARAGEVSGSLSLKGAGPFDLLFTLESDPSKTAIVPLPGSRAAERTPTLLGTLGRELRASLLPGEKTTEVRGLHQSRGDARPGPVDLVAGDPGEARLVVTAAGVETLALVVWDPLHGGRVELHLEKPEPGASLPVAAAGPFAIAFVGAWVSGQPWEAWTTVFPRSRVGLELFVPDEVSPGTAARIHVKAGSREAPATVSLVVKDDRLVSLETPRTRLAADLKATIADAGDAIGANATIRPYEARSLTPRSSLIPPVLERLAWRLPAPVAPVVMTPAPAPATPTSAKPVTPEPPRTPDGLLARFGRALRRTLGGS